MENKTHYQKYKKTIKKYHENNKETLKQYNKEYHENNKEKIKKRQKFYYEKNKEAIKKRTKKWRQEHKERYNAYNKEYYEKNKETLSKYYQNRRKEMAIVFQNDKIKKICDTLRIPEHVQKEAISYLERIIKLNLVTKGLGYEVWINICIHLACRNNDVPLLKRELSEIKFKWLSLLVSKHRFPYIKIDYTRYISRFYKEYAPENPQVQFEAIKLFQKIEKRFVGYNHFTVLSAVIYVVSGRFNSKHTQETISSFFGITNASLRIVAKKIMQGEKRR